MRLYSSLYTGINGPYLQVRLCYSEGFLYLPQIFVAFYYFILLQGRVSDVAFEPVPLLIFLYFFIIERNIYFVPYCQELIIAPVVDTGFGKLACFYLLFQFFYSPFPVVGVFDGPCPGIADNELMCSSLFNKELCPFSNCKSNDLTTAWALSLPVPRICRTHE